MRGKSLTIVVLNTLCWLLWLCQQQYCHAQLVATPTTHDMRHQRGECMLWDVGQTGRDIHHTSLY